MVRFLDFIEKMEDECEQSLPLRFGYREIRIVTCLLRSHLSGRMLTSSSLAAASGLSYGTAVRAIEDMHRRGLIIRRPRTASGKSYSLHPTAELLARWQEYARRVKALINPVAESESRAADRRSGTLREEERTSRIIPPPAVLTPKLTLPGGLRLLLHADPTFMAMRALKRHFELILGIGISSRALSIDRLRSEIIDNSQSPVSRYDIIACDLPWFGEMGARKRLLPLDECMAASGFDTADFHPDSLASTRYHGRQYGIPILTTAEILVYRTDLLAAAGIAPPVTARDAIEAARRLHNPATGVSGIAWNGGRGTPVGHTFIMIMGAFGQPIVNLRRGPRGFDAENVSSEEMRPMLMTPGAERAAEYLRELLAYSPPGILRMAWYDRAIAYARGRAAMAYSHTLLAPLFELDAASPAYRRTGYGPHPYGPGARLIAPLGGYALAIPANLAPERVEAAWTALRALTTNSAAKLYMMHGSLASPRFSVSRDPEVRALSPMIAAVDEMARLGYLQMWPRPPIPELAQVVAILGEEVHDMLSGEKPVREALAAAQNRVDALMRAQGYY
jgi:multiple sugar transport system substrate-binding protein